VIVIVSVVIMTPMFMARAMIGMAMLMVVMFVVAMMGMGHSLILHAPEFCGKRKQARVRKSEGG